MTSKGALTFAIYALTTPGGEVPTDLPQRLGQVLKAHAQRPAMGGSRPKVGVGGLTTAHKWLFLTKTKTTLS
jgi:hypothetical protein